ITVFDDGKQSRCFTWVGDAVHAIIELSMHPAAVGEVTNIGSEQETTILELAELTRDITASASEIVFVPYDEAYEAGFEDMRRRVPDLTKLRRLVGFDETVALPEIVSRVAMHYRARGQPPAPT